MDSSLYHSFYELETTHWWFVARSRILLDLIERYSPPNQRNTLLDIGCGTGVMLQSLHPRFGKVYGLDCSPLAVKYTNQRLAKTGGVAFQGTFPNEIPFADETFDVVLLLDVLEHLDDDEKAIRMVFQLLKMRGILVSIPAYPFLWSGHDDLNHHRRRYVLSELKPKLVRAGFLIEKLACFKNMFTF